MLMVGFGHLDEEHMKVDTLSGMPLKSGGIGWAVRQSIFRKTTWEPCA